MKKFLLLNLALFWGSFLLYSQDSLSADTTSQIVSFSHDTVPEFGFGKFGNEKGGQACENGIEKLEVAVGLDGSVVGVNQNHAHGPGPTQIRTFVLGIQEPSKNDHAKGAMHFFDTRVDITWKQFPIHVGCGMGIDMIDYKPNLTYSGFLITGYFSDIETIHHVFHILSTSFMYSKYSEHLQHPVTFEDSLVVGKQIENFTFFQTQPFHVTKKLSVFSEGIFRMRKGSSFSEIELGMRHHDLHQIGIGVKASFEDMGFHTINLILRFNMSNPNPKFNEETILDNTKKRRKR